MAPASALMPLASTGVVPAAVLLIAGGAAFGFAVIVYNVAQVSFRQRVCPPPLLGRMNASVRFIVWGSMPIGGLLGGWLGTHLGVLPTLWVSVGDHGARRGARGRLAAAGDARPAGRPCARRVKRRTGESDSR